MMCSTKQSFRIWRFLNSAIFLLWAAALTAGNIYVDANSGNDSFDGTQQKPFKTLQRALLAIPDIASNGFTVIVNPGVYEISEKIRLDKGTFSEKARLTLQASMLPDHPDWTPKQMPVFTSTENPGPAEGRGEVIHGFSVEVSHVSFRGLRFLGNPSLGHRYYPIRRDNETLANLLVSQCIFEAYPSQTPIQVAVIAKGQSMIVEHSIFLGCNNPTVYWQAEGGLSYGNVFRNCIALQNGQSGLWTTDTASDFEFRNNLLQGGRVFHMQHFARESVYTLTNSYVLDFDVNFRSTEGPGGEESQRPAPVTIREHRIFRSERLQIDENFNQGQNRNWLHPLPDSPGWELGAGLFRQKTS